jgi:hypothetical protein
MACTPVAPVPITATRFPVKSTGSCGQAPVWYQSPWKVSRPGHGGRLVVEMHPTAVMKYRAVVTAPSSVVTSQRLFSSSYTAALTRVLNWMSRRRSILSVTKSMYSRISACPANRSLQVHSSRICGENLSLNM